MAIVSREDFCLRVEENAAYHGLDIIQSVLEACEYYRVDIESVKNFINTTITERLALEAAKKNLHKVSVVGNLDQYLR